MSGYRPKPLGIGLAAIALFLVLNQTAGAADSSCLDCHTSPAKLVKITRDLYKNAPQVKSESEGPG